MRKTKLTQKRKEIIQSVIDQFGFTKKSQVREHLNGHPEYDKYFNDIGIRYFNELIEFDYSNHDEIIDEGHFIRGRTIQTNGKGEIVQQWVKSWMNADKHVEIKKAIVKELTSEITPLKPIKKTKRHHVKDIINQYTLTDYHLGMMACAEEIGEDWTIEKAEKFILDWYLHAVSIAPESETCVFAQLGDFLHFDSIEPVTPSHRHILDASTRFVKLVRVAIRVLSQILQILLKKHKKVHVIFAEGNHDISSSIWLREAFNYFMQNNKRLTFDTTGHPYYAYKFGKVGLFFHHGHKRNLAIVDKTFVSYYPEIYGETLFRYGHTGHEHHDKVKESPLMRLEQHPTLAPKDAYALRGGYNAMRTARVTTYHKDYGKIGENSVTPEMILI